MTAANVPCVATRKLAALPAISVHTTANYFHTFTSPSPDLDATISNDAGDWVGRATFAVSPLNDAEG